MTQVTKRTERHDEDLVRAYLDEIGRHELLTKDDEACLAQDIDAGRDSAPSSTSPPPSSGTTAASSRRRSCGARPPAASSSSPTCDWWSRSPRSTSVGAAAPRPRAGGQPRVDARGREVRLAEGLQVLDVRDVVDPPGDPARHRQHRSHDPTSGPRRRQPAAPAPGPLPARGGVGASRPSRSCASSTSPRRR